MKTLSEEFDMNADGLGVNHFKLIKRKGKVVIYERTRQDGILLGFEVFKVNQTTFPLVSGGRSAIAETYPRATAFGKTAYFCMSQTRAEIRFVELLNK